MKTKLTRKVLELAQVLREVLAQSQSASRGALVRPFVNLAPPPPQQNGAVAGFYAAFGAAYFPFCVQVNTSCLEMYLLSFHHKEIRRTNYEAYAK